MASRNQVRAGRREARLSPDGGDAVPFASSFAASSGGRRDKRIFKPRDLARYSSYLLCTFVRASESSPHPASVCEEDFGVVLAGVVLLFRARTSSFGTARLCLSSQVDDERADIALSRRIIRGAYPFIFKAAGDAGHIALNGGFLIARRAVELPSAVPAGYFFRFQRRQKLQGVDAIVLDRVGAAHHFGLFEAGYCMEHFELNILGERRGKALHIKLFRAETHRFNEQLVPFLVLEADDLVLNRGAVPWPDALDDAGKKRASVQIFSDDAVRRLVCIGQITDGAVIYGGRALKENGIGASSPG